MSPDAPPAPLRSFGRIKARALKPRQQQLIDVLLPHLAVEIAAPIEPEALFPNADRRVLEIGFGAGEHLVGQACAHPNWGFIGVEPFQNGMGAALARIEESGAANIRLHLGDARDVIAQLPDGSLDQVDILFPDPWPKARHWKRRLVQPAFAAEAARILKRGGELRFATDWAHYAAWALEVLTKEPAFEWTADSAADWRNPWPGHITTRYEAKRLGDCAPIWLSFRRSASC